MPPLYRGIPRNQALFRGFVAGGFRIAFHFDRGGQPAMIQPSISTNRHLTDAPIRTGAGILPFVCHFRIVVGCTSNLTASAWASIKDSVGAASFAFAISRLLHFPL
jgi:hypothetical protein